MNVDESVNRNIKPRLEGHEGAAPPVLAKVVPTIADDSKRHKLSALQEVLEGPAGREKNAGIHAAIASLASSENGDSLWPNKP